MFQISFFKACAGVELIKEPLQLMRIKMVIVHRVVLCLLKIKDTTFRAGLVTVLYNKVGVKTAQDIHRSAADIIIRFRQLVPARCHTR